MNLNPADYDRQIDAVLGLFAHAEPRPGLERRVTAHLASHSSVPCRSPRFTLLSRITVGALSTAAACGIVVGSVAHSRHSVPLPPSFRGASSGGIGTAGAVHIPTHAIHPAVGIQAGSLNRPPHSRATVPQNHAHRTGAAVPKSPYPPQAGAQPDSASHQ